MKKSDFWIMVIFAAALAAVFAALEVWLWAYSTPKELAQGAIDNERLCQNIVDNMPELEGASASEISFDKSGMYYVTYRGKMYVVEDAAIQNNIEAFRSKYFSSCDYEDGVTGRATFFTCFAGIFIGLGIGVCLAYAINARKELAKNGERIFGSFKIVT